MRVLALVYDKICVVQVKNLLELHQAIFLTQYMLFKIFPDYWEEMEREWEQHGIRHRNDVENFMGIYLEDEMEQSEAINIFNKYYEKQQLINKILNKKMYLEET